MSVIQNGHFNRAKVNDLVKMDNLSISERSLAEINGYSSFKGQ